MLSNLVFQTKCEKERCLDVFTLNWHHDTTCKAGAVCPTMSGNICGDFVPGVAFRNFSSSKSDPICIQGDVVENYIGPGGKLLFYVYVMRDFSNFTFDCYVWCTYDGKMPHKISHYENSTKLIVRLYCRHQVIIILFYMFSEK